MLKNLLATSLALLLFLPPANADTFYFLGIEDSYFENPLNWFPHYPGTQIGPEDRLSIQVDAHFTGFDLNIAGVLEVVLGARLYSSDGSIVIHRQGKLLNHGEVIVSRIENHGRVNNLIKARLDLRSYHAFPLSYTQNFHDGELRTTYDVINEGHFDNYSYCHTGGDFLNLSSYYGIGAAKIDARGECLMGHAHQQGPRFGLQEPDL